MDAAQRYGFVQENSMPITGIQTAMYYHEKLQINENYLKKILKDKELLLKREGVTVEEAYNNIRRPVVKQTKQIPPNEKLLAFVNSPFKG